MHRVIYDVAIQAAWSAVRALVVVCGGASLVLQQHQFVGDAA
jgi:hypothetical protein